MKYKDRVAKQMKIHRRAESKLMSVLQEIAPGYWVVQYFSYEPEQGKQVFRCVCHNGDDNLTAEATTLGAATARVIAELLDGWVYPLGGAGGKYIAVQDRENES